MRIGIIVNDLFTEEDDYTTTHLAMAAVNRGHEVWYIDVDAFALRPDDHTWAHAWAVPERRRRGDADMRSNMTAGAVAARAEVTDGMLAVAEATGPRLKRDGIFFAGLDIVGDKIMEINIQSPGGLASAESFEKVPFDAEVIHAIERKIAWQRDHTGELGNTELAAFGG